MSDECLVLGAESGDMLVFTDHSDKEKKTDLKMHSTKKSKHKDDPY